MATEVIEEIIGQLAQKATLDELNERGINVKYPPAPLVGAKGDGKTDDSFIIQNILNSGAKEILFPIGVYLISNTISVPDYVDLKLFGDNFTWKSTNKATILKLTANVDMLSIGSNVSIKGGILDARSVTDFSKALVKVDYSGNKEITGGKVDTTLLSSNLRGHGIEFYADAIGTGLIFPFYVNGSIQGFKKGIYSHKSPTNTSHWFSGLFIDATIANCESAVDLAFGGNGGRISGSCQPLVTSGANINANNSPLIRVGGSHMMIDCTIWDMTTAINSIALENNGQHNVLYGNLAVESRYIRDNSIAPRNLRRIGTSSEFSGTPNNESFVNKENMNGYQDNLLLGAHKKFTVTQEFENTYIGGGGSGLVADGMFLGGEDSSYIALQDNTQEGKARVEITFDRPRGIKYVGLRFTQRPYRCRIELFSEKMGGYVTVADGLANDMYLQSGGVNVTYYWEYDQNRDFENFGGLWERKISKTRYTIYLSPSSTYGGRSSCNPSVAFAYDGSLSFIPPYGGTLYGDLIMKDSYIGIGVKNNLPIPTEDYRGRTIIIKGNGSGSADTVYICLMSSTGVYGWKPILSG